jgi:hypothetical protein
VIVPGHGEPRRDKTLLRAHMSVMRELLKAGKEGKARGLDPDQAREEVLPRLHDLMISITGTIGRRTRSSACISSIGICTGSSTS